VALLLASCGSSGKATTTKTTTGTAGTTATDYGSPGNAAMADRTISVQILPTLMYNPAAISVSPGETVTFKVTNNTTGIHEFVLGDQQEQQSYQNLMASMGSSPMTMPDHSNIVNEQAGVTKELTWTFPSADTTVIYGSHEPGDYTHGLMGTITVGVSTTPTTAMSNMTTTTQMGSQPVTTMGNMPGMTTTTGMANMPGMTTTTTGSSGM
jgi:uncharacterized cupredoxin-like copper-binding protein